MSELVDLEAVKARFQQVTVNAPVQYAWHAETPIGYLVEYDVPALVAEVLALRAKVAAVEALPPETAMEVPTRVRVVRVDDIRSALSRERVL